MRDDAVVALAASDFQSVSGGTTEIQKEVIARGVESDQAL